MPYVRDGKCVYKQNADGSKGALRGCSDSEEEAKRYMRALYAHETKEAGDMPSPYNAHGPGGILSMPGQGSTTPKKKKKKGVTNSMTTPKEIQQKESQGEKKGTDGHSGYLITHPNGNGSLPTGVNGKPDHRLMAGARAALQSNHRGEPYQGGGKAEALAKLKRLYEREGMSWDESKEWKPEEEFLITKDAQGKYRYVLITSSAFEDRDGEIVSQKALAQDVERMTETGDYGEGLWWHCDGDLHGNEKEARPFIPLASCDFVAMHGRLRLDSGEFYDDAVGKAFAEHQDEISSSISFYHPADEPIDGVYEHIRTKERSFLPKGKESNLLTKLLVWSGRKDMDKERVAKLKELLGDETLVDSLLAQADKREKAAEDAGLTSKEMKAKKKPAADDEENAADQGDDEAAEGEKPTKKEAAFDAVAFKEAMTPFADAMTAFKELSEKQNARMNTVEDSVKLLSRQVKALLGDQPKGTAKGYRASEAEDSVIDDTQKASVKDAVIKKYKEMSGQSLNEVDQIAEWLMTGEYPVQQ